MSPQSGQHLYESASGGWRVPRADRERHQIIPNPSPAVLYPAGGQRGGAVVALGAGGPS